jgi:hypothetical protein
MEMWQRLDSLNRSLDFVVLCRVTRNKDGVICVVPSEDLRAVEICLTLIMSKPRSTSPSAMSCAGVLFLQLDKVICRCQHYWGRPARFLWNRFLSCGGLCQGHQCPCWLSGGG